MPELEGQSFANYEILAKLGQGGMGAVYKARQPALNRLIALKVLPAHLSGDQDFVARFKREAAAAASLNHDNLVQVYAAGESQGIHYIAMEFVEGESLQKRIERNGKLDPAEALACCYHIAEALRYAWNRKQIIHRDIKPDNIFLSDKGEVKVGDLGLAKRVGGETTGLTQTGMTMGSPHYVSPEQAQGKKDIDFHADIYSLGCTLFHMITGTTPYDGTDAMSVMMKHVNEPPPAIFKVWPTCPMPLAMLLGRMLKKNPRERHASYEELIAETVAVREKIMGTAPTTPAPAPVPRQDVAGASAPRPSSPTTDPGRGAEAPPTFQKSPMFLYAATGVAALAVIGCILWWAPWSGVKSEIARSPRLSPSAEPWVDRMAEVRAVKVQSARDEGSGRRFVAGATLALPPARRDGAVRMLFSYDGNDSLMANNNVIARWAGKDSYRFRVNSSRNRSQLNVSRFAPGKAPAAVKYYEPPGKEPLPPNQPIELELRAVGGRLTPKLNGIELEGVDDSALAAGDLGISLEAGALLHAVETLDLSKPASASPAVATGGQWVDALAQRNVPAPARVKSTNAIYAGPGKHRDLAIRATLVEAAAVNLILRGSGKNLSDKYNAGLRMRDGKPKAAIQLFHHSSKEARTLGLAELPGGFDLKARHTTEFLAQGNTLVLRVDGIEVLRAEDSTLAGGTDSFLSAPAGSLLERLEYRELPPAPQAGATP